MRRTPTAASGRNAAKFQIGRGPELRCKGWRQEGLLRMLENTLANGERPEDLVIYAGTGKVARNWECFHAIVRALKNLADDETLVIQSGKPVAVFRTTESCPRVLAANTNLVGKWATWEHFRELESRGLMMYGQYTAGTWAYIGTQGILQGTFETFAAAGARTTGGSLEGHIVLTAGLGGMGGAQPLAVKMAGGVCVAVEVDRARAERRFQSGYCEVIVDDAVQAVRLAQNAAQKRQPLGIALIGNAAEMFGRLRDLGLAPSVVTDQTSAHDPLNGYVPVGVSPSDAEALRARDPKRYVERSMASMARHVEAMLAYQADGAITFEYGNYLRGHAQEAGVANAYDIQGFVPLFVRPGFCRGRGPFRWVCLSGDPADLKATDDAVLRLAARRRSAAHVDDHGRDARADPGIAGAHVLARARRARPGRPDVQRHGQARRAQGTDRDVPRSPGQPARSRNPAARPKACWTAAMRSPTGRCSMHCSTPRTARTS